MSLEQASDLTGLLTAPEYARRAADGGVDVGDSSPRLTKDEVTYAKSLQQQYDKHGGWRKPLLATIGTTSPASAHAGAQKQADACSTMPDAVLPRLLTEGVKV